MRSPSAEPKRRRTPVPRPTNGDEAERTPVRQAPGSPERGHVRAVGARARGDPGAGRRGGQQEAGTCRILHFAEFCQNFVRILSNFRQILAKFP